MHYDVFLQSKKVGIVTLKKQGLYYKLECFCDVSMQARYNLILMHDASEVNLGICVPFGTGLGLKTRIKVSTIQDAQLQFQLIQQKKENKEIFYPVFDSKPFTYLDKLESLRLTINGDQTGVTYRS